MQDTVTSQIHMRAELSAFFYPSSFMLWCVRRLEQSGCYQQSCGDMVGNDAFVASLCDASTQTRHRYLINTSENGVSFLFQHLRRKHEKLQTTVQIGLHN